MTPTSPPLRLVQINVWSGSKYTVNWSTLTFDSYESPSQTATRYSSLLSSLRSLSPDVITANECMGPNGCRAYVDQLARDMDMDAHSHVGVAGIVLGPLHVPSIRCTEGDAILTKKHLKAEPIPRARLTGFVFREWFSLNTEDATQVLAVRFNFNGKVVAIGCTHWHAGILDDDRTREHLKELEGCRPPASVARALAAVSSSTGTRLSEAAGAAAYMGAIEADVRVLSGDLNTTRETPEYALVTGAGYVGVPDAGATWDPGNPNCRMQGEPENGGSRGDVENEVYKAMGLRSMCLDHVMTRPRVEAESRIVMNEEPVPSDHYGILVDMKI